MYFHTESTRTMNWLSAVCEQAADTTGRLRIDVDGSGRLRVKSGGGMWCAPIESDPDPFRDRSFSNIIPAKDYSAGMTFVEVVRDLINMDALGAAEPAIRNIYNKVIQGGIDSP